MPFVTRVATRVPLSDTGHWTHFDAPIHFKAVIAPIPVSTHGSTKCITERGVGWRALGRREEKHGQLAPVVERRGTYVDRDIGDGLNMTRLNPAGLTAPDIHYT